MDAVPYEISQEDVDQVLSAYEPTGGGDWPDERRQEARGRGKWVGPEGNQTWAPELDSE